VLLLEMGLNREKRDKKGRTLENGADINMINNLDETCLEHDNRLTSPSAH